MLGFYVFPFWLGVALVLAYLIYRWMKYLVGK